MKWAAALMVIAVVVGGCSGETEKEQRSDRGLSGTCGLRKIAPNVNERLVSDEFLLEGVELAKTTTTRGRFIAIINAPYSVNEAYRAYLGRVKDAGWDITTHETEGFEAEIYMSDRRHLAAVQVRTSTCEGKVVVYVSIVDREPAVG